MMATFADRLAQICREEKLMTVDELAKKLGMNKNAVYGWMSGKKEPMSFNLLCVADALGVSMDWLMGRTDVREMAK